MLTHQKSHAGIDYYTATSDTSQTGMNWFSIWQAHSERSKKTGSKVSAVKRFGYDCLFCNGLTWGRNSKGHFIMISSGIIANRTWQKVVPIAKRITRIDMQYTFVANDFIDLTRVYSDWASLPRGKRKASLVNNTEGGQTLYIGSRKSDQFGRFYYKTAEANLKVKNVYRLEVELKKPRADLVVKELYDAMKMTSIRAVDIKNYVCSWFADRHIAPDIDFETVQPVQLAKVLTSDEKRLIWLRSAVAPTLADLIQRGKTKELAEALGLKSEDYQQLALDSASVVFERIDVKGRLDDLKDEMTAQTAPVDA